jgi:hypothetical protein
MAHVKLHFAKRASASGTHLFPDLSIQLSQFNWRPSARRTHFFVTFMRFTLIGADPGGYDSASS